MNNYLVIIDDGFTYRAVLAGDVVVSSAVDIASALSEFRARFSGNADVLVVSNQILSGAIQLPPGTTDGLGFEELNQLVQFELSTRQSVNEVLLGEVLLGRGVLTHSQLNELLMIQKECRKNQGPRNYRQLGTLAIENEYATQRDIDLAIDVQRKINAPPPSSPPLAGIGKEFTPSYGLAAGIEVVLTSQAVRDLWLSELKKVGLRLTALLPLAGATREAVRRHHKNGMLLEFYNHHINVIPLDNSAPVETIPFGGKELDADQLSNLLSRVTGSPKIICAATQELYDLVAAIGEHLTPDVKFFAEESNIAILVACSATSAVNSLSHATIPLKNPPRPLKEQPYTPWVVAAVLFLCAIVFAESLIRRSIQPLELALDQETDAHQKAEDMMESAAYILDRIEIADAELAEKTVHLEQSQKESELLANLTSRSRFHLKLLEVLMETISDGVIVDGLVSSGGNAFILNLWSVTPQQGSQFVEKISNSLTQQRLTVEVLDTRAGNGHVGVEGIEFVVRISPQVENASVVVEGIENVH